MVSPIDLQSHFSIEELKAAFLRLEEARTDKFDTSNIRVPMGADGIEYKDFKKNLDRNLREISTAVLRGSYTFYPLRQVDIPKDKKDKSKGTRTLSIARIRDVLVQKQLYRALYDRTQDWFGIPKYDRVSVAYRRKKSAHDAIRDIWRDYRRGYRFALDADIEKFFDKLNHNYLMSVVDRLLGPETHERQLIWRYINTRYICHSEYKDIVWQSYFMQHKPPKPQRRTEGVPQGGVLSGMLANLYLHEFDKWIVDDLGHNTQLRYYRYADDFVILTKSMSEAEMIYEPVRQKLNEMHLTIHALDSGKTRLVEIPKHKLEFLGFRITAHHIQVKPANICRFKERFSESIKRIEKHTTEDPEKRVAELVKYYSNSKIIGPPDDCPICHMPRRRYNWISFFAPVITDMRQLHALDVWMRKETERYVFRQHQIKVKNRKALIKHNMTSLIKEYRRYKRGQFCQCEPEDHPDVIDVGTDA